jgi:hypothetical protein
LRLHILKAYRSNRKKCFYGIVFIKKEIITSFKAAVIVNPLRFAFYLIFSNYQNQSSFIMSELTQPHQVSDVKWSPIGKFTFLFFFLFLGTTSIAGYNIVCKIFDLNFVTQAKWFSFLSTPLGWFDKHLFHIGLQPGKDFTVLADGRFGYVLLLTMVVLSLVGAFTWTISDSRRANYSRLYYWFRLYLAYYLFLAMLIYAFEKIIPTQMAFPNAESLLTTLGDKNGFTITWDFIGSRPAYSIFTGICELTAALLILFRRTRVFGCLFMTTVLANVVCFNIFYNVPVKILSIQLLVITLFLLAPFFKKLVQVFYCLKPVSLAEKIYVFTTPWKKYLLGACLWLIPAWAVFLTLKDTLKFQRDIAESAKKQQLYNVTTFINGNDTLSPLLTDTLRWKRIFFTNYRKDKYAIVYNMNEGKDYYGYTWDSINRTITLTDADTTKKYVFHYSISAKDQFNMTGKWHGGKDVNVYFDKFYTDSMPLIKEKIRWIQQF